MTPSSLSLRLILGAAVWIAAALVATGIILTGLFRDQVEGAFDEALRDHMEELLALATVDGAGTAVLRRHPLDPRFNRPLSGWYWVFASEHGVERSRSLWDGDIAVPGTVSKDHASPLTVRGPRGEPLRAFVRRFTLAGADAPFTILVAGPAEEIERSVGRFARVLALSLFVLGVGLVGAAFLQVRYGLRPLRRVREALTAVRAGRASRMEGAFAPEVEPLVGEINALLDHNARIVERARTQAGNLAHALKTPLAVIANEADRLAGDAAETIRGQVKAIAESVERQLSRARMAGAKEVLGVRTPVEPVVEELRRTLASIYRDRGIVLSLEVVEGAAFAGERGDLEEMLGNLMDNACKFCRRRVRVGADREDGRLVLTVEDDGPGIPDGSMDEALGRGRRLDETRPGSGLGLAIVRDMAEAYGGALRLAGSPLGGLRARLHLPLA